MTTAAVLAARGLFKQYGRVVALDGADFEILPGEVLAVIGDNGAGKSTLIKALCGFITPDAGVVEMDGQQVSFRSPLDARKMGIETVYQDLALSPALSIVDNMYMGRTLRRHDWAGMFFRTLDHKLMRERTQAALEELGILTIQNINQAVETLSGGQRQAVAIARAVAFGSRVIIMDEPTAALGVKESRRVLEMIEKVRSRGMPVVLISHNMPQVFEVAHRIHVHRLGKRLGIVSPKEISMSDAVALMTGATSL